MKITIDTRWINPIRNYEDSRRLELYDAIFDYMEGRVINLSDIAKASFSMIAPALDTQKEKTRKKKKETDSLFGEEEYRSTELKKLDAWMEKVTPYIYYNIPHLKQKEFDCLLMKYSISEICDTLQQIENRKDLRKRYTNLYRTLLNWLKNNYGSGTSNE